MPLSESPLLLWWPLPRCHGNGAVWAACQALGLGCIENPQLLARTPFHSSSGSSQNPCCLYRVPSQTSITHRMICHGGIVGPGAQQIWLALVKPSLMTMLLPVLFAKWRR